MEHAVTASLVLVPIVLALVQVLKPVVRNSIYHPIVSLVLGLVAAFLVAWADAVDELTLDEPGLVVLTGVLAGLGASGAYSSVKTFATEQ